MTPAELIELPVLVLAKLEHFELTYQLDLGDGHWLQFSTWRPDLALQGNRDKWGAHEAVILAHPVCGATVIHRCQTETGYHQGGISFRTPATELWTERERGHRWEVHSWDPLDISPSLLAHCPCKDHGFIRAGKWVRA